MPDGARIVVKCNHLGQPIGDEGGVLGKFLGTIARLGGYCPLDKKDWRNVKKDGGADTILQCVQTKFLYPAKCDKWILKTTGRDRRRFKAGLKKIFFNANKKRKSLYKLCPEYVDSDQWRELVKFWKSKEGRRQEDPEKKQPHRAKVYLATHRKPKKAKDKDKFVVELEKVIDEQPELAQSDQGRVAWKGDALHKVLGNEKPGQVHGMGLLPVPNQVYGRKPRYLKNINMTTTNGSSHDEEADAREEIAKLKQRIEQQDQIIDALRNKDEVCGTNKMATENFQIVGNGESHPEVLHNNKRKRVHANGPDAKHIVVNPRDTTMKHHLENEGCNKFSYQVPSSPAHAVFDREMRKSRENMDGNLTRVHKQSTQDKSVVHVPSKQKRSPSMEVGTKVILKSSIYPNKRHVAHASILGCSSKKMVGGVELGRQFIEVQVDQPIEECERLVRERENCMTIGDAFTSGLTIAWPSACIERFNG
ncbi:hypothetical protein VPH35_081325 [Triticum aestivum]|uniref:DUF8039 domain-containing protein n=1 Tax=Triticum turgidum subsp. durum TaxID=4567 RepID=A0A9R0WIF9_TRITD|nr:unnamed protein product [Triticum turgidum subsp. durum]